MVVVLQKSVGVRVSASYCRSDNLEQYQAEPRVYTLGAVVDARVRRVAMIGGGKGGASERLVQVLGLPEGGGSCLMPVLPILVLLVDYHVLHCSVARIAIRSGSSLWASPELQ